MTKILGPRGKKGRARTVLLVGLVALVVVGALAIELSSEIRRGIQRSMVRGKADRVELEFRSTMRRLFEPLEANLRITRRWGDQSPSMTTGLAPFEA